MDNLYQNYNTISDNNKNKNNKIKIIAISVLVIVVFLLVKGLIGNIVSKTDSYFDPDAPIIVKQEQ